jgi:hypothetical protein
MGEEIDAEMWDDKRMKRCQEEEGECLFNDAISTSDYLASNSRVIRK